MALVRTAVLFRACWPPFESAIVSPIGHPHAAYPPAVAGVPVGGDHIMKPTPSSSAPDTPPTDRSAPREVELKLFVPPSSVARIWSHPSIETHAIGPMQVARIDNRYFDTPEQALAAAGMALRLRRIGRRWVQTLKAAHEGEGALSARSEWEMPVAGAALELARFSGTPLDALGAPGALGARLKPIFTTNFRRETRMLRLADGSEVEFAFDVGRIDAGRGTARRSLPICEVEIEVKQVGPDGPPDLLRFAARLADDVALIPLAASKAARGHRLAAGRPLEPSSVELPAAKADDTVATALAAVLARCNAALSGNVHALFEIAAAADVATRDAAVAPSDERAAWLSDPADHADRRVAMDAAIDFVHQARVAVRRMRSAVQTLAPALGARRAKRLDGALRVVGRTFGTARDWDVLLTATAERLDAVIGTDDAGRAALVELRDAAQVARTDAHRALVRFLDAGPFGATVIAVERTVERLRRDAGGKPVDTRASAWLSNQRQRVVRPARRIARLDDDERHGLRIEVKRLRYGLDLFEALYDTDAVDDYRDALAALQNKLGRMTDATAAATVMAALPQTPGVELARIRFDAWLQRSLRKQLPKVAALAVALELTPAPWGSGVPDRAAGDRASDPLIDP